MKLRDLDPRARIRAAGFPLTAAPTPAGVEPLPGPALGDDYDTAWARRPAARATRIALQESLGRVATTALCRPKVTHLDRLDRLEGPAIFVANHHSHLDFSLVSQSLPRPWRHELVVAAAADYFFDRRSTAAAAALVWGAVPMERLKVSRRSALRSAELLADGWSLLIFPEGGRSPDGWGQDHKGGAAYLGVRCGLPVVPIHIDGTDRVLPKGTRRPRPATVTVNVGAPLHAADDDHPGEDARRFARRIEAAVELLADETRSDWYSARLRAAAGQSPSLKGPEGTSWRRDWARGARRGGGSVSSVSSGGSTVSGSDRRGLLDRARGSRPW